MNFEAGSILLWGGIAAVLIPVLIHLFNRTRYFTTKWAAMEFLLAAMKKTRRRVRIENLILLLMRIIVLFFIAMMLARPSVSGEMALHKSTHLVIVLDNSYSMSAKVGKQSAFEKAKELVYQAIAPEELGDGDAVSLIRTSETPADYFKKKKEAPASKTASENKKTPKSEKTEATNDEVKADKTKSETAKEEFDTDVLYTTDKNVIKRKLKDTTIIAKKPDWLKTLELVKRALKASKNRFDYKRVVIITDMQKINFEFKSPALKEEFKKAMEQINKMTGDEAKKGDVNIIDVGANQVNNCAIVKAELLDRVVGVGVPLRLKVKVGNFSLPRIKSQKKNIELRYSVDGGKEHHLKSYPDLLPGDTITFALTEDLQRFEKPGIHAIQISLSSDNLLLDDSYYLIVDVIKGINILVVDGDPRPDRPQLSETFNFILALPRVSQEIAKERRPRLHPKTLIYAKVATVEGLTGIDFFDYDIVLFANVKDFEGYVPALERYVKAGYPLIITLGDKVNKKFYNDNLYKKGKGLLPGELVERVGSLESLKPFKMIIDDPQDRSIADMYKDDHRKTKPTKHLIYPNFYVYFKLKPDDSPQIHRVISLSDKSKDGKHPPLLIEKRFGRGLVSVFTSSLDTAWNTMPAFATFIAFWHETVYKLTAVPRLYKQLTVSEPYKRPVSPKEYAQNNRIFPPGRDVKQLETGIPVGVVNLKSAGREGAFRGEIIFRNTNAPGVYTIMMLKNRNTLKFLVKRVLETAANISPPVRLHLVELLTDKIIEAKENREQAVGDVFNESVRKQELSKDAAKTLKEHLLQVVDEFLAQKEVKQTIDKFAVNLPTEESDLQKLAPTPGTVESALKNIFGKEFAPKYISYSTDAHEKNEAQQIVPAKSTIWRYIGYALFILLALEMFFALLFTKRQR